MGVGSGKSFSSVGILSADRPLEICLEISASKSQLSKGPPQGHDKLIKDPVQVHNRYGHLDDSEEESVESSSR
jgi:hypothetical protein